jgi:hypothetical protein
MPEMKMNDLEQLQRAFARPERIADGALLAGSALAMPLVSVRRRQARMEAARAEARLGADHPETKRRHAQAAKLATRAEQLSGEIDRQKLQKPPLGDQAGLYGRVTRDGAPCPALAVAILDEQGEMLVHSCTGRDGGYALSFPPGKKVRIEIRDTDRRLFRDDGASEYPPYRAVHRDIEMSKAKPICPGDKPADYKGAVQVPGLVGMDIGAAERNLRALGLAIGKRRTRKAEKDGIVLEQDPVAGTPVAAGSAVDLVVSKADEKPASRVPDLTGRSLHQAVGEVLKAGAEIGSVNISSDGGKTVKVQASNPDETGDKVHLHVSAGAGDSVMGNVVATVLATTAEAAAIGLGSKAATADWLKKHKLTNIDRIGETLAMEDAALRKHFRMKADEAVGSVRGLLQAAVSRVRKV